MVGIPKSIFHTLAGDFPVFGQIYTFFLYRIRYLCHYRIPVSTYVIWIIVVDPQWFHCGSGFSFLSQFGFTKLTRAFCMQALMANAATSALRLHQRLPQVQFTRQFLFQFLLEDSGIVRFQNVRFTKRQVYKMSGFKTSGFKKSSF